MNKFMRVPYVDGGRTLEGLDCWGLVLAVRQELGLPGLSDDPLAIRGNGAAVLCQFQGVSSGLVSGQSPRPGTLAAVFKGRLFVHVGVVVEADGRLWVIETNPGVGVSMRSIPDFAAAYYRVVFYCDRDLPESS